MKRVIRPDESEYFVYSEDPKEREEEKKVVLHIYKDIKDSYDYLSNEWKRLHNIAQKRYREEGWNEYFFSALDRTLRDVSNIKQFCNVTDPYGEIWSNDDDRQTYGLDVTLLYNLLHDLKRLVCQYGDFNLFLIEPFADQLCISSSYREVHNIRTSVIKRAVNLYLILLKVFEKLCAGDELFKELLSELKQCALYNDCKEIADSDLESPSPVKKITEVHRG